MLKRLSKIKTLGLFLALFTGMSIQLNAQEFDVYASYCFYEGAIYHIADPDDYGFYECNPAYVVKWKHYNEDCELQSVTYGSDSEGCLCGGTLQVTTQRYLCQTRCQEITLPDCRESGGGSGSENAINNPHTDDWVVVLPTSVSTSGDEWVVDDWHGDGSDGDDSGDWNGGDGSDGGGSGGDGSGGDGSGGDDWDWDSDDTSGGGSGGSGSGGSGPSGGSGVAGSGVDCDLECGSFEGEDCDTDITIDIVNVSNCFAGGIIGTIVNGTTGENFDCSNDQIMRWRHYIPNPDFPCLSNAQLIVTDYGSSSDFDGCLCGGSIRVQVKNACCERTTLWYPTPPCRKPRPNNCDGDDFFVSYQDENVQQARTNDFTNLDEIGNEVIQQTSASIFPNPVHKGFFNLSINNAAAIDVQLRLFSQDGRLYKTIQNVNDATTRIDVSDLTPGIYWINVTGTSNFTEKVIVH